MNLTRLRKDFPILKKKVNGKPLAYMDNGATSQKPVQVINAIRDYYENFNANAHRGAYALSLEASKKLEECHHITAEFLNANDWSEICLCRNATEGLNAIAHGLSEELKEDDEILLTKMEHHSNIVPWQIIAREKKARLKFVNITKDCRIDWNNFEEQLSNKTKIVAFSHASNALGTINDAKKASKLGHSVEAKIVIDGCQSAPHLQVDLKKIDCDFFAFSGHKMLAPFIGAWFGKEELLKKMKPFLTGGDMISTVTLENSTWREPPWKFEAGTQDTASAVGLTAAIKYLQKIGLKKIREHESMLLSYALRKLKKLDGIKLHGTEKKEERLAIISFNLNGIHPHDAASILDSEGICIRSGDHCAQPLMKELGINGSCRASFYLYNTKQEIDRLVEALEKAQKTFS